MSRNQQRQTSSTRQSVKQQRIKKQRQQRIMLVSIIAGVAVLVIAIIVLSVVIPQYMQASAPVGDVVTITPIERPFADGTVLGKSDAPVLVEVFSDFQCPACKNFSERVETSLVNDYVATGKVRLVYRHNPFIDDLSRTKESDQAANASECASEQGRFWDYHDMLFANWNGENQGAFYDKRLIAFAEKLGLDMEKFESCFKANQYDDKIQADITEGESRNVTWTPSIFINGELVPSGLMDYLNLQQRIESALAAGS
jgi:protein-disulfide isomerase